MPNEITIRAYEGYEDLIRYHLIFDKNSDSNKSIEFLKWMHTENPNHLPLMHLAIANENNITAALYAVFAVKFKFLNTKVTACQSIDTITDIEYRGKGLFINLAKAQFNECQKQKIKFVYGFPNINSINGFINKLNWKEIAEVPFLIRPLRLKYLFQRVIKNKFAQRIFPAISTYSNKPIPLQEGWEIKPVTKFDNAFDELWVKLSENIPIGIQRDAQYLNWRLLNKPNEAYSNMALYNNQKKLIGFISYCIKNKHQGRIGYVLEFLYDRSYSKEAQSLFTYALNDMNIQKTDAILAWSFKHSENFEHFKKAGFKYLHNRFRPIKLFFGGLALEQNMDNFYNKKNWYISYCDSDTI